MNTHHVCYEGTLACSGCNPCQHCLAVVNSQVLASAMKRTTEVITQARGPQGVVTVAELDAQNFWAVFVGYYNEGWRSLHAAMKSDPKVAERAYDLRSIPGFEATGRYVPPVLAPMTAMPPMQAMPSPPPAVVVPSLTAVVPPATPPGQMPSAVAPLSSLAMPAPAPPGGDGATPWSASFVLREEPAAAKVDAPTPADVLEAEPKLTGPTDIRRGINADDIAASATILETAAPPATSSTNGVATHD